MSLDNANPTVFQNATGGGRRRFKNILASKANERDDNEDELALMSVDELLDHYQQTSKHSSFLQPDETTASKEADQAVDYIDSQEIYDLISTISDPEHPLSLGSLAVVNVPDIHLSPSPIDPTKRAISRVVVEITPTVTHCSLATVIGLGIRVRLEQSLPPNIRVDVRIKDGTHSQGDQVNKQLGDKERVAAALENATLMAVIRRMLDTCE